MWSVFPWHRNGSQGSSGIYHPSASAECWDERHVVLMPGLWPIIDKDIEMKSGGGTWVTLNGPARPKFKSRQGSFPPQLLRRLLPIVDSVGGGRQGTDEHVLDPWWRFQKHRQSLHQQKYIFKDNWAAAAENRESRNESWKDFWKKVVWREIFFFFLRNWFTWKEKKNKCQSVYLSEGHEKNVKCKNLTSST